MAEISLIERIVDAAVSRILESHIPSLREDMVRSVMADLLPEFAKSHSPTEGPAEHSGGGTPADLLAAISAIHTGTTQKEIRGFENSDAIKDFSLDLRSGIAAQAMQTRSVCAGITADVDARFMTHFRAPTDGGVLFLPLLLKDKIAALVYADAGVKPGGKIDSAALELVVATTSAWLEVISLRKQAHKEGPGELTERPEAGLPSPSADSTMADPFAAHAPTHRAAGAPQQSVAIAEPEPAVEEHVPMAMAASATHSSTSVASNKSEPEISVADQDTHRKAQRFARLLIDEIKLYNKDTVVEGRKNQDLYDRLKEDIEKSRITYQKRYGSTAAADSDYFNQELVRSLAEDNVTLLGVNYPH